MPAAPESSPIPRGGINHCCSLFILEQANPSQGGDAKPWAHPFPGGRQWVARLPKGWPDSERCSGPVTVSRGVRVLHEGSPDEVVRRGPGRGPKSDPDPERGMS